MKISMLCALYLSEIWRTINTTTLRRVADQDSLEWDKRSEIDGRFEFIDFELTIRCIQPILYSLVTILLPSEVDKTSTSHWRIQSSFETRQKVRSNSFYQEQCPRQT